MRDRGYLYIIIRVCFAYFACRNQGVLNNQFHINYNILCSTFIISLFVDTAKLERRERLEDAVEELRGRFGKRAITYATLLGDLKMPGLMYS